MKPNVLALIFTLLAMAVARPAPAQDKSAKPRNATDQQIAQLEKLLDEDLIETVGFQERRPLAEFLPALECRLLKEKKNIALRIDKEAFGAQLAKITEAEVRLPHFPKGGKTSLRSVLHRVLKQLPEDVEAEYGFRDNGIVLTRPQLAAHRTLYDVPDILEQMPSQLPEFQAWFSPDVYPDLKPTDGSAVLVRLIANIIELRPRETIEVLNGTRLVVFATPGRHEEVRDLLSALRRLGDTHVVMNARLIEVDRAFFTKEVAPLFAKAQESKPRIAILAIDGPLFKKIAKKEPILESEDVKIPPYREETFLSQQRAFRFAADLPRQRVKIDIQGFGPHKERASTGTGLSGVSFRVRARVSPDRRYLRLQITQNAAQLVGIEKTKKLDAATGKEVEIESPNLRKTTVTGTVQIPDGNPILMPVDYRSGGKGKADKVRLLVARPYIWIEEEALEHLRGGGGLTPQSIWDSEVQKDETRTPVVPATRLPRDDDTKDLLQAVITDVLTNPDLKDNRAYFGTARDKTFTLVDTGKLGWPKEFCPETHGYKLVQVEFDPFMERRRVLGIRLDKFDLKQKKAGMDDPTIEICLFNAGGRANGDVSGGRSVYYTPKRVGMKWVVEYEGSSPP